MTPLNLLFEGFVHPNSVNIIIQKLTSTSIETHIQCFGGSGTTYKPNSPLLGNLAIAVRKTALANAYNEDMIKFPAFCLVPGTEG
jgi:hypothetical protein